MSFFTERDAFRYDLADVIRIFSDDFIEGFRYYWGLDENEFPVEEVEPGLGADPRAEMDRDEWIAMKSMEQLAKKYAQGASSLVRPPRVREEQLGFYKNLKAEKGRAEAAIKEILEIAKADSEEVHRELESALRFATPRPSHPSTKIHFFNTCLQIQVLESFASDTRVMGQRITRLFEIAIRAPGIRTMQYLGRVAECYIRDMKTEFAVMARAALEAAIDELLTDEEVENLVGRRAHSIHSSLSRRMDACVAKGLLNGEILEMARQIRVDGNNAVHLVPDSVDDIHSMLERFATVLAHLEPFMQEGGLK